MILDEILNADPNGSAFFYFIYLPSKIAYALSAIKRKIGKLFPDLPTIY